MNSDRIWQYHDLDCVITIDDSSIIGNYFHRWLYYLIKSGKQLPENPLECCILDFAAIHWAEQIYPFQEEP